MQSPYQAPKAQLEVEVSVIGETDFVKSYVCFAIGSVAIGSIVGAVLGFLIGAAAVASGTAGPTTNTIVMVTCGVAAIFLNYFIFRFCVIRFIVVKFVPELRRAA